MHSSATINLVQTPIIPVVNEWIRTHPDTLSLGQGMVAYPPPASALAAIANFGKQAEQHYYSQAWGEPALLDLIKAKLSAENGIDTERYALMITAGSNMAFLNILLAIVDAGDEIILPVPYYFNQEMAIRLLHCQPVCVATDENYQLNIEALRAAITPKTRAIVTVSPNNPSGAVYSQASLRAVNALCADYGLYHISDEAYEYFVYDDAQHFSAASISDAQAHTITLYSLSKAYGFASWRLGYVLFPKQLRQPLLKVQDTNLICPPLITQYAAIGALQAGFSYCQGQQRPLIKARCEVLAHLASLGSLVQLIPTQGAFYVLLKVNCALDDMNLVQRLITEFKVAVIPGRAFGLTAGCYVRISYGMLNADLLPLALTRLITGLRLLCQKT